ncbi:MAG: SusC/RagA family TonB-linked outer membrane protein [Marivirga sp.]|nr:SusC/RagA family TonB-linked outer membrane protein [Marivirga sp.]
MTKNLRRRVKPVMTFILSFCFAFAIQAQNATVTGKVTSKSDGTALPGVNVFLKGTSTGTTTDSEGKYTLTVSGGSGVLAFSFIGFASQEISIGSQSEVNVVLEEDATQLSEVVVTALGITKDARKLGYAVTTVNGDQLDKARTTNVALSLQGTVAGLNVKGTSSGPGGTAKILLRGMPSMNSGGAPLFVINGVPMDNTQRGSSGEWGGADNGDGIGNINPDDIETMTVLKGQSASALYGARASNGVIIINTKKGKKDDFSIEYNMNYIADKAINNTDFQYEYGQGSYGNKPTTAADAQLTSRMSWGSRLDGSQVIQFDGNQYAYSAQKDNIKNFYRTGTSFTNTVSVSKGGENGAVRLSLSNLNNKSIVPNSGLDRKTINLNVDQKITNRLSVNLVANYINEESKNRAQLSDGPMNANNGQFLATNVDERILGLGYDPATGVETRWGDDEYVTNPYFVINKYVNNLGRKRLISSLSARYDIFEWLYVQARIGYDSQNDKLFKVTPWGTAYSQGFRGGLDDLAHTESYELNIDGLLGVSKKITTDISLDALLGVNSHTNESERIKIGGGPFILPNLYSFSNVTNFNRDYSYFKTGVNSAYYSLDLAYKGFLTVSTTGRYDDYSTLYSLAFPEKKTSIFTPSVSTSLIFSELLNIPELSFGKLRASLAQTSGELGEAYKTSLYYSLDNSFSGIPMGSFSSASPNYTLKPFTTTEVEIGTELKFFENRVGFDVTWYNRKTENEIMPSNFSRASGAESGFIGTGSTKNTGIELQLKGTPVRTTNLTWDITANFTSVKNEILSTDEDNKNQNLGSNRGTLGNAITAFVVGTSGPQILAYDYKRSSSGEIVVDASGLPIRGELIQMGSVMPKYYGGITNELSYKAFTLSFLIDYNFGNKVLSATEYYSILRGLNKTTLEGREEGIRTGVTEAGAANTVTAEAQDYYRAVAQQITSTSVVSGDYIKLRQLTLGYSVPASMLANVPVFRSIQVAFVGRNLATIMKKADNIDPESSFGSNVRYYGIEGTSLPSTSSYGVNVNFKFK